MAGKHTPGPWTIERPSHISWEGHTGAYLIMAGSGVECRTLICERPYADTARAKEHEANARLIAAAPNLLDACKSASAALDAIVRSTSEQETCQAAAEALKSTNEAVSRALGEG